MATVTAGSSELHPEIVGILDLEDRVLRELCGDTDASALATSHLEVQLDTAPDPVALNRAWRRAAGPRAVFSSTRGAGAENTCVRSLHVEKVAPGRTLLRLRTPSVGPLAADPADLWRGLVSAYDANDDAVAGTIDTVAPLDAHMGTAGESALRWWAARLEELTPAEALPFSETRATSWTAEWPSQRIYGVPYERLASLAQAHDTSPEHLVLAALLLTLNRRQPTGSATVRVALTPDLTPAGPVALLPVWIPDDTAGTQSDDLGDLAARLNARVRECAAHWVPSAHLLRGHQRLGPGGIGVATGSLQIVRGELPTLDNGDPGACADPLLSHDDLAQVVLGCHLSPGRIDLRLVPGRSPLGSGTPSPAELARMLDELVGLLLGTSQQGGSLDTDLTDPDQRPTASTVSRMLRVQRRQQPNRIALETDSVTLDYAQLDCAVDLVCVALHQRGVRPGDLVALRVAAGSSYVVAMTACLRMGASCLTLPTVGGAQAEDRAQELGPRCWVIDSDIPTNGGPGPVTEETLDLRLLDAPAQAMNEPSIDHSHFEEVSHPESLGYVMFSSGTTGRPKAIPQRQGGLAEMVAWLAHRAGVAPGSRVANWASPGYDAGICEIYVGLAAGATVVSVPDGIRANPRRLGEWLSESAITHLQTVPSFLRALVHDQRGRDGLSVLEVLMTTGEMLTADLVAALLEVNPRLRIINLYGPTEVTIATHHEIDPDSPYETPVPVGRPVPGREVLILDRHDRPAGPGTVGEIVVRGPYISDGYLGADADVRDFQPHADLGPPRCGQHNSYRTGDLGHWSEDGDLILLGRRDRQIKFNGVRVELGALEGVVICHPQVAECAVIPTTRDGVVVRLRAQIVPTASSVTLLDERTLARELRFLLRKNLGGQCPPISAEFRATLARNIGGKYLHQAQSEQTRGNTDQVPEPLAAVLRAHGLDPDDPEADLIDGGRKVLDLPDLLDDVASSCGTRPSLLAVLADPRPATIAALLTTTPPANIDSESRIS